MGKIVFATFAILAVGAASNAKAAPAWDPKYAVCMQTYEGISYTTTECDFDTMAQCQMSASGRSAGCIANPYYQGPPPGVPGRRSKRRHHATHT